MPKRTKINHAQRTKDARQEWDRMAKQAHERGYSNIVRMYQPESIDGWATIERAIAVLRWYIESKSESKS